MKNSKLARLSMVSIAALFAAAVAAPARAQVPGDQDQYQYQDQYDDQEQARADQDAYVDETAPAPAPDGHYVVTETCPAGCWVPYAAPGATIVFGGPAFPTFYGRHWTRPFARPYAYRGWRAPSWHGRYHTAPRTYAAPRSRSWSGSRGSWGHGRGR